MLAFTDRVTVDEIVDVTLRAYYRLDSSRRIRQRSVWITAVSTGVLCGLLIDAPPVARCLVGSAVLIAMALFYPRYYRHYIERSLRNATRESMGDEGPYEVRYEIDETAIRIDQAGVRLTFPWADLVEVEREEGQILLWNDKNAGLVVRYRAFNDQQQKQAFLRLVETRAGRLAANAAVDDRSGILP